jgi:hypothetical protein
MAYFPQGKSRVVREFGDAFTSVRYDEISHMAASNPDTRVLLAQLWASPSKELLGRADRLPPLAGSDADGREWLLVFDGRVGANKRTGEPYTPDPPGQMSSEKVFSGILKNLGNGPARPEIVRDAVKAVLDGVADAYAYDRLNLALTDGTAVYLARCVDKEAEWNEMWYTRLPRALVGCSEPLKTIEQPWERLGNRTMLVLDPAQNLRRMEL